MMYYKNIPVEYITNFNIKQHNFVLLLGPKEPTCNCICICLYIYMYVYACKVGLNEFEAPGKI